MFSDPGKREPFVFVSWSCEDTFRFPCVGRRAVDGGGSDCMGIAALRCAWHNGREAVLLCVDAVGGFDPH